MIDDAQKSSVSWLSSIAPIGTWRTRNLKPTESIGGVLAKDPSKVESVHEKSLRTL